MMISIYKLCVRVFQKFNKLLLYYCDHIKDWRLYVIVPCKKYFVMPSILLCEPNNFYLNSFNLDWSSGNCDRGINQEIEKIWLTKEELLRYNICWIDELWTEQFDSFFHWELIGFLIMDNSIYNIFYVEVEYIAVYCVRWMILNNVINIKYLHACHILCALWAQTINKDSLFKRQNPIITIINTKYFWQMINAFNGF